MKAFLIGIVCVIGIGLLMGFANYNSLVVKKANVDNAWAKVEVDYQKRLDLVTSLIGSVKGAQKQEQVVFGNIAESRKQYSNASTASEKAKAASDIETNIALLPRLQEAYPELKSNQQVQSLMNQLEKTEDGISTARSEYNTTATKYNVAIKRFPTNIFANMFGYSKVELFKSDDGANKAVKVEL